MKAKGTPTIVIVVVMVVSVIAIGVVFNQLPEFEKRVLLFQLTNAQPNALVYDAGYSTADFDGFEIINCLRGVCPTGLSYEPEQVLCSDGKTRVSEFVYPEACPAPPPPTTRSCPDGSVIAFTSTCPLPDADSDGIPDNSDICPNTLSSAIVNTNGCATSQLDSDGDGVFDDADLCPSQQENVNGFEDDDGCFDTPPPITKICSDGTVVELTSECPLPDSDGDGVPDNADLCSNTSLSDMVNINGCAISQLDTDSDGIFDNVDVCITEPETVNGFEDEDGCPDVLEIQQDEQVTICFNPFTGAVINCDDDPVTLETNDSDDDGILNNNDICPNSSADVMVDSDGCEVPDLLTVVTTSPEENADNIDSVIDDVVDFFGGNDDEQEQVISPSSGGGSSGQSTIGDFFTDDIPALFNPDDAVQQPVITPQTQQPEPEQFNVNDNVTLIILILIGSLIGVIAVAKVAKVKV